ncbi:MAG: EAL domain-containing protein [Candidatus Eremiobacteraeota bacterium]|nr:EAL domain-containing protein [Candidatus Eremiobacteraeota bacterium]
MFYGNGMLETPLARLLEVTRDILEADDLDRGLLSIASAVCDLFRFKYVTIVAAEDSSAPMQRRVMIGWPEDLIRERIGERVGRDEIRAVLKSEFEVFESCYFIPAESEAQWSRSIYTGDQPIDAPRAAPDRWHERDSLTLVLRDRIGGMLGYMSVDGPLDGAIPSREPLRSMQLFVNLVGLALANARAHAAEVERRRLLEASHAQLRYEATHDGLTRLPNRQLFSEELEESLRRAGQEDRLSAVLFVDLDEFKTINDTLGHLAGDRVLLAVGERLRAATDGRDVVARLGGDEFAVLLRERRDLGAVQEVVDKILNSVIQPIEHEGGKVFASASVGIAAIEPRHGTISDVLREADTAMYAAKTSGRAKYAIFDAEMHSQSARRLSLISGLREAIDERQFTLQYQPIVGLDDRRVVGVEALVRWHHPRLGRIEPGEFIPLAEDVGIVVPIGRLVLDEACRRFAAWKPLRRAAPIALHVNLAVQEILQPDIVAFIERILAKHALEPSELTLEITEHAILRSSNYADAALVGLRRLGTRLCIDDFGTGYSSLRYLQEFPIDALKIDRSFIHGPRGGLGSEPIVKLLAQLAASYEVDVIAEGIEHARQSEALLRIGCRLGQGYLFAEPLDADAMTERLVDRPNGEAAMPPAPERTRARAVPPR